MLSETLANLTRRIAREFDHLSEDEKPEDGVNSTAPAAPLQRLIPESATAKTPRDARPGDSKTTAAESTDPSADETPQATAKASSAKASTGKPAQDRRPAKKTTRRNLQAKTAEDAKREGDEAEPTPSGDWRRIHVN